MPIPNLDSYSLAELNALSEQVQEAARKRNMTDPLLDKLEDDLFNLLLKQMGKPWNDMLAAVRPISIDLPEWTRLCDARRVKALDTLKAAINRMEIAAEHEANERKPVDARRTAEIVGCNCRNVRCPGGDACPGQQGEPPSLNGLRDEGKGPTPWDAYPAD
jgi:hypothetical protein